VRLLVVRHAIAEARESGTRTPKDDESRALTPEGRRKMERGAAGLRQIVPEIELLASSPLRRAAETADIIAQAYGDLRVERIAELAPAAGIDRVITWLESQRARGTIAVVGHEPDLSQTVCALLAGTNGPFLELRKGAACLLEFPSAVGRGAATLDWFLGPSTSAASARTVTETARRLLRRPAAASAAAIGLARLGEARAACTRLANESDRDALHDFRVAVRRLRTVLRAFRRELKTVPKKLERQLRDLTRATSGGRDAEVQLAWLAQAGKPAGRGPRGSALASSRGATRRIATRGRTAHGSSQR